ncbi:MAG: clan AA aspartic protease [Chloroflexi bacterium]|nr:clan AA aspartic protease [Chloroflexota bacterium]
MGTFRVPLEVGDPQGQRFVRVEAIVDTGASHTLLPRDILLTLGIRPRRRVAFELADDRIVEYDVGEAVLRLDGQEATIPVAFGPEGAKPLLGATALEILNLAADPVRRRLVPVPGLLK